MRLKHHHHAFSLTELLAVIGMIALLAAIVGMSILPLIHSTRTNQAANLVADEFNMARQAAITRNCDVEIRFYRLGDSADPANKRYRALAAYQVKSGAEDAYVPLDKVQQLPGSIVFLDDPTLSTLLDHGNAQRSGLVQGQEQLPAAEGLADYVGFRFRASGETNLAPVTPPNDLWFVTLCRENAKVDATTKLPGNFATIQVEPVTGRVRTYRP